MKIKNLLFFSALALILSINATQAIAQSMSVAMQYAQAANANIANMQGSTNWTSTAKNEWTFSATTPSYTVISVGDITFPIQIHTPEHTLSNPKVGLFKIQDAAISALTRIPLDTIVTPAAAPAKTNKIRPTLFISLDGYSKEKPEEQMDEGKQSNWQSEFSKALSTIANTSQYKHFWVNWDSSRPIPKQADMLGEQVKNYLADKKDAWDVVIVGYSRGAIFGQELTKRIGGYSKISKLHLLLLDPTAASSFGDVYPNEKFPGTTYGYLKYDGQAFLDNYVQSLTDSDRNISGFDNYGNNDFFAANLQESVASTSHKNFAKNWVADTSKNGLKTALQYISSKKDNGSGQFFVDEDASGNELLVLTLELPINSADLDAQCTDSSCYFQGYTSILGDTNSLNGMVGTDGMDVAVTTTFAAASTVVRRNQIAITNSAVMANQSTRVDLSHLTANSQIATGTVTINTQLSIINSRQTITIGNVDVAQISNNPFDAIITGTSSVKKAWKKLKKLF